MNSIEATEKEKEEIKKQVEVLFQGGIQVWGREREREREHLTLTV